MNEKPEFQRLAAKLGDLFPAAFGIRVQPNDDALEIVAGDVSLLRVDGDEDGQWTVYRGAAHAHRDSYDDAVELILDLLKGEARFATEYRNDDLAASWIETQDGGEAFEKHDEAAYLSPFEALEWEILPDDRWRVVRETIALGTSEGVQTFERPSESPSGAGSPMLGWLETALGPAPEGLRWAVGGQTRFVFAVPRTWRRRPFRLEDRQHNLTDFLDAEPGLLLRARAYFRDAQAPVVPSQSQAAPPLSIERAFEKADDEWSKHAWTLLFSDGEQEMMGILELFFTDERQNAAEAMRESVDGGVTSARFVPREWDMGADRR